AAVQERDDLAVLNVSILHPDVWRRTYKQSNSAADLVELVTRSIPVEAEARRELERAFRSLVMSICSIDCKRVRIVLQEIADVAAEAEREGQFRSGRPAILRVD